MNIGIVLDGSAERAEIECLCRAIRIPGTKILKPVYAAMQPKAAPGQIARAASAGVALCLRRGADRVVVLIDLEDRDECCPQHAVALCQAFNNKGYDRVSVVVKNRCFENWLIADIAALRECKRFAPTKAFENKVAPNKADNVADAAALLNGITTDKRPYHKRADAAALAEKMDPVRAAANSRSFRRFLRELGHPRYREQSKKPVP